MVRAFIPRTFPSACKELQSLNKGGNVIEPTELKAFELLHQWRQRYASIKDDVPAAILSTTLLVQFAKLIPPVTAEHLLRLGLPARMKCQLSSILRVLNDKDEFFQRVNGMECHNCMNLGHAAVHCPFPSNRDRMKDYFAKHPEEKAKWKKKRRENSKKNKQSKVQNE
jgi:ribonuclease D